MERHEIELLEKEKREEEFNNKLYNYKEYMVSDIQDCLLNGGCLTDVINTLDLEFDEEISLEDSYVNECVLEAVKTLDD